MDWEKKGFRINGERLSHLQFGDDILIFNINLEELKYNSKGQAKAIINTTLKINFEITKMKFLYFVGGAKKEELLQQQ